MKVKVERINSKQVRLEFEKDGSERGMKLERSVKNAHHKPGIIDQANIYIIEVARALEAEHIDIIIDTPGEITDTMMAKAKAVHPYRGTYSIIELKEEENEPT